MVGFIAKGIRGIADWRRRQIARAELESLDDRTLADIGLRRGDIPMVLSGKYEARESAAVMPVAANLNTSHRHAA